MSTEDVGGTTANDLGGNDDMLSPMEATDSDDVRNADGDEAVDPPEDWSGADRYGMSAEEQRQGESLDHRLAEEVPDVTPDDVDLDAAEGVMAGDLPVSGSDITPEGPGTHQGQIDGAPEDGEPLFRVVE